MSTHDEADRPFFRSILFETFDTYTVITLNRPQLLNALDRATFAELDAALGIVEAGPTRALIITGAGDRAFAAGADIAELRALGSSADGYDLSTEIHGILKRLQRLAIPVIMAVNGFALGGGCELAMAGDIILASDRASFGQPEVNLGLIPGYGGTIRLPRLVGRARALEMILADERLSAESALRAGLINRVVPAGELMAAAISLATTIAGKAPRAVALAKRAVYEGLEGGPESGSALESALFGLAVGTQDREEGTQAFLDKRSPVWRGR